MAIEVDEDQQVEVVEGKPRKALVGEDERDLRDRQEIMREVFSKQKRVSIKTLQDEWVQINDYTFIIKGGVRVDVPEQVADFLEEMGRI